MNEILKRAADNLCSEGWDEEAAAVSKAADHIEKLEKFKSIHAKCDEVSLELEQKLISQLAKCHRENGRLRAALEEVSEAVGDSSAYWIARTALEGEKTDE